MLSKLIVVYKTYFAPKGLQKALLKFDHLQSAGGKRMKCK